MYKHTHGLSYHSTNGDGSKLPHAWHDEAIVCTNVTTDISAKYLTNSDTHDGTIICAKYLTNSDTHDGTIICAKYFAN